MAALDGSFDAIFLVGHHAKVRDFPGFCAHTISYGDYADVRLAGRSVGEPEMFITAAAQHGVPCALITGDDIVSAEVAGLVPGVERAVVKRALSRTGGVIVPPARAQRTIFGAASKAIEAVRAGSVAPIEFTTPFAFEVQLKRPISPEGHEAFATRFREFNVVDDHTLAFSTDDMQLAFRRAAIVGSIASKPAEVRSY
jgi:D-amino peptidase